MKLGAWLPRAKEHDSSKTKRKHVKRNQTAERGVVVGFVQNVLER